MKVVQDTLHGLEAGFILGPFTHGNPWAQQTVISPLGLVDKKGNKHRVVHDLSHGKKLKKAVNSFIHENFTKVKYVQTQRITRMIAAMGQGAFVWMIDMAEAYRRVLLHPRFHKYLGFKWHELIFRYICLPFGLSSSPQIYSSFAECLRRIIIGNHPNLFFIGKVVLLLNYLDDFFGGHPDYKTAWTQYRLFRHWLVYLGIPTQDRKCSKPNTIAIILGFLYNTIDQTLSVPKEKIELVMKEILQLLSHPRRCTRRQIARMAGLLNWLCQVVFGGRAMIRSLEFLINVKAGWDRPVIRLTKDVIQDLRWWLGILQTKVMVIPFSYLIKSPSSADIHIWTDASGSGKKGLGAYNSLGQFLQVKWKDLPMPEDWKWNESTAPEYFAIVVAMLTWAESFSCQSILIHSDNIPVVSLIKSRSVKKGRMDLSRFSQWLTQIALFYHCYFWISYIPGKHNIEADALSRFKKKPFDRFLLPMIVDVYSQPFFDKNPYYTAQFTWKDDSHIAKHSASWILTNKPVEFLKLF